MDYKQAREILDKYGEDKCMQIIFDNGRVWLTNVPKINSDPKKAVLGYPETDGNGKIQFYKFSEIVTMDEATDSIRKRTYQHGVDYNTREVIQWDIVNPIEGIQGFNFLPEDVTEEQEYIIRSQWDHTIV